MSCGIGHIRGLDPELLWLWLAAVAPVQLVAWELPYHTCGPKNKKKQKKKKKRERNAVYCQISFLVQLLLTFYFHDAYE